MRTDNAKIYDDDGVTIVDCGATLQLITAKFKALFVLDKLCKDLAPSRY